MENNNNSNKMALLLIETYLQSLALKQQQQQQKLDLIMQNYYKERLCVCMNIGYGSNEKEEF